MLHDNLSLKYLVLFFSVIYPFGSSPMCFWIFQKNPVFPAAGMHSHRFLILKPDYVNITSKLTANQIRVYENA